MQALIHRTSTPAAHPWTHFLGSARLPHVRRVCGIPLLALCLVLMEAQCGLAALSMAQNFNLRAGWNAIWLEVTPENQDVSSVFGALPLDSVWTYATPSSAVDFIQNPDEPVWNRDRWLVHVPTDRPESLNNNLFKVLGNRAYLVNLKAAATFTVSGSPRLKFPAWTADAYNLRGFPIDPDNPPTFLNFFKPSPSHYNATQSKLQKIYQLNSSGQWTLVSPSDLMKQGEAYWVYTAGASDYIAPLTVSLDFGDGLDLNSVVTESPLHFRNRAATPRTATVLDMGPSTPLTYREDTARTSWLKLPSPYERSLPVGGSYDLLLSAAFASKSSEFYDTLLRVKDGQGTRYHIPVILRRTPVGTVGNTAQREAVGRAGLWVGTATINAVSEAHAGTLVTNTVTDPETGLSHREVTRLGAGLNPTPTDSEFSLRLLLHVDTNGTARLLKDVVQMWQPPVLVPDGSGSMIQKSPGRYVLLTDESLLPLYEGAALRDGEKVGRRLSSADFPFPSSPSSNFLPLTGFMAVNNNVSGSFTLGANDPLNPFKHKYHPDHDNLDATFTSFRAEAYDVTRTFQLTFTSTNTVGLTSSDYGYTTLGGIYQETVKGIHRSDIVCRGVFQIRRAISTPVLNQ